MTHLPRNAALRLVATCLASSPSVAASAGVRPLSFTAAHQDSDIQGHVWFPAEGGTGTDFAANPVFRGVPTRTGATIAAVRHPVVLLSHGPGGLSRSLSWLAAGFAERGAIVVGVDHPGSTVGDLDFVRGMRHWTRAQDPSAALDAVAADPSTAAHIDPDRVFAAGFSYGGWTALSLGGLRGNRDGFVAGCAARIREDRHCQDLARAGVDIATYDADAWNRSWRDERVKAVVAIEPGLTFGVTPADVTDLIGDVLLIGLGAGPDRLAATDVGAAGSGFAGMVPAPRCWRSRRRPISACCRSASRRDRRSLRRTRTIRCARIPPVPTGRWCMPPWSARSRPSFASTDGPLAGRPCANAAGCRPPVIAPADGRAGGATARRMRDGPHAPPAPPEDCGRRSRRLAL